MPHKRSGQLNKLDARTKVGIYVGIVDRIDELIVMTESGIEKVRTIYRCAPDSRWDTELLNKVKARIGSLGQKRTIKERFRKIFQSR